MVFFLSRTTHTLAFALLFHLLVAVYLHCKEYLLPLVLLSYIYILEMSSGDKLIFWSRFNLFQLTLPSLTKEIS